MLNLEINIMKKNLLVGIVIVTIIALVIFFYPKYAGETCGLCPVNVPQKTEYGCIGLKYEYKQPCLDCGTEIKCMGIVTTEKKCYSTDFNQPITWTEVPCV
jgi:hypothetical protein